MEKEGAKDYTENIEYGNISDTIGMNSFAHFSEHIFILA